MSTANKTRYEVQKILADCIKSGLSALIGPSHGFDVMEFAQASFQKADRIVLMNLIRSNRIGWQGRKYIVDDDKSLKRTEEWISRQHWQLNVILKASKTPSIDTLQADDIASLLITWFNGKGNEEFRKSNVANERVDSDQLLVYSDDSELYQKRAVFTVKLQVPMAVTTAEDEMTATSQYDVPDEIKSGENKTEFARGRGIFGV